MNAQIASTRTGSGQPVAGRERIEDIDVIRGFALFGVLMMNLAFSLRVHHAAPWENHPPWLPDHIVLRAESVLLANKAMTLFSTLFGVGLAIFLERASASRGDSAAWRLLVRRLLALLAFGVAHAILIWNGDILVPYAVTGLLALPLMRCRTSVLAALIGLGYVLPPLVLLWPPAGDFWNAADPVPFSETMRIYTGPSYLRIVQLRAHEMVWSWTHHYTVYLPRCLGNMLIGVLLWRSGIFRADLSERMRRMLRWVATGGIAIGAGYALYRVILFDVFHAPTPTRGTPLRLFLQVVTVMPFALGYGAILLLLLRGRFRPWLLHLAPLGRMAFTNYLTESIFFTAVFYGYGLNLLGKVGYAAAALMGIIFFAAQGILSAIWLRHFRFGPFEWAWRTMTYGAWQPFRKRPSDGMNFSPVAVKFRDPS
ncbi:DUF418 domain-containing protein [Pendulispora brunnea]|uniref:DUF418 domain-containing protein n=1 Tax=Pendulispora brunnea TaxID=2905690 RepID=A0ABZ2KL60_9BACT